jgi:hypothetical protein
MPVLPAELPGRKVWERTVGRDIGRDAFVDSRSAERQLLEQSRDVARRLEGQGIPARAVEPVHLVGLCTGQAEAAIVFRNSNLIPIVQARNVHAMLRDLRYVVETTPARQLRMAVVSNGWQPLAGYRRAHCSFTRRLSRFAAHPQLEAWGVEVLFYNIENTVQRDAAAMLNMHSHLVIRSRRRLGPVRWRQFLDLARSMFPKRHFHDAGRVIDPAECVKYAFKPAELAGLDDAEFAELFRQSHGLKFFHPLGGLREMRRELKRRGVRLAKVPVEPGSDDRAWCVVPKSGAPKREPSDTPADGGQVVGVTFPQPRFGPRAEPCLIVRGYAGSPEALFGRPGIRELVEFAARCWDGNVSPSKGHTTTTTVRGGSNGTRRRGEGHGPAPPANGDHRTSAR